MHYTQGIYQTALIIGNGFDLNLGLKTSYSDFILSVEFGELLKDGNELCRYLIEQHELEEWIDIENQLKIYSRDGGSVLFEEDYNTLCNCLINYLKSLEYSTIDRDSPAYLLMKKLIKSNFHIFDFNYTESTKFILTELGISEETISERIVKMHGSISIKQIIFGVEDEADIQRSDIFLKKSYSIHFNPINLSNHLKNIDEVFFFGHSLGETDHMYFFDFFLNSSLGQMGYKKLHFYFYKQKGYKELHIRLDELTLKALTKLKQNNKFIPYDSSTRINS